MKLCTVEGCDKKHHGKGYCAYHLRRLSVSGSTMGPTPRPMAERFWEKADRSGDCWEWTATKLPTGYGQFNISKGVKKYAHRLAYELTYGAIPDGMQVDHMCHNVSCINPEHLRAVTQKQNQENRAGAQARSVSGVRGVYWHKGTQKWMARVMHNKEWHYLGIFSDLADAEAAVTEKRLELYTHNDVDRRAA